MVTPILLDKSAFGAYFLFGGLALGTVGVLAVYMPETRGRSLENIQEAFQQPSSVSHVARLLEPLRRRAGKTPSTAAPLGTDDEGVALATRASTSTPTAVTSSARSVGSAMRVDVRS